MPEPKSKHYFNTDIPRSMYARIVKWRESRQEDVPSFREAVRQLLDKGLKEYERRQK